MGKAIVDGSSSDTNDIIGAIIISPSCANNCVFCKSDDKMVRASIREQEKDAAKNIMEFLERGINSIEISGADPIEYANIIPLIRYLKQKGYTKVQLTTHGRKLSDAVFREKLLVSGVDRLRVPLYGSTSKIHDSLTRAAGSFDQLASGLKAMAASHDKPELQISTIIMQENRDDIPSIMGLAVELGVDEFFISVPCISVIEAEHYLPLKDCGPYVRKAIEYARSANIRFRITDIPYCVIGHYSKEYDNMVGPPDLGNNCQPPDIWKTQTKNLPSYRVKTKLDMCQDCVMADRCDGFFVNDVKRYGVGSIKPLMKPE